MTPVPGFAGKADPLTDACGPAGTRRWLCDLVFDLTDSRGSARVGHHLSPWLTTAFIVLGALLLNRVVRRLIKRVARRLVRPESGQRLQSLRRRTGLETSSGTPALRREQRAQSIGEGLRSLSSLIIGLVSFIAIFGAWGIELGSILAGAGLLGVMIGFGAQNLLRDLISGTFMLVEDQFGIGDVIDVGDAVGTVERMSLRTTRLRDVEGVVWHVPNGEVKRVGNKSQQWSRAILDIPVAYDSDVDVATEAIKAAADSMWRDEQWSTRILAEPEVLGVESIAATGVTIRLAVKTLPAEQWKVARELRVRIKSTLDDAGIERPPSFFVGMPEIPRPGPGTTRR
jgi:small conductance mechanosensitive channel